MHLTIHFPLYVMPNAIFHSHKKKTGTENFHINWLKPLNTLQ